MGQITGGKIGYGRTTKPADYESKRADAEFSFIVEEGEDPAAIVAQASALAVAKVNELLGLKVEAALRDAQAAAAGNPKPRRQPPGLKGSAPQQASQTAVDPAAVEDLNPPASTTTVTKPVAPTPADDLSDVMGSDPQPPKEINDQELQAQVTRINGKIKNPTAIRGLIAEYVGPPPKTLRDIPKEKRAEFLDKADKLPPGQQ